MAKGNGTAEDRVTERVVLRRASVLVIPEGVDPEKLGEAIRLLMPARGRSKPEDAASDAWIECGTFEGASKRHSIEKFAGKAGTADAKTGVFKAPSLTSWKGSLEHVAPPKPLVQARMVEE